MAGRPGTWDRRRTGRRAACRRRALSAASGLVAAQPDGHRTGRRRDGDPRRRQAGVRSASPAPASWPINCATRCGRSTKPRSARSGSPRPVPSDPGAVRDPLTAILRLGPDDPQSLAWLWAHWGTTRSLRHVTRASSKPGCRRGRRPSGAASGRPTGPPGRRLPRYGGAGWSSASPSSQAIDRAAASRAWRLKRTADRKRSKPQPPEQAQASTNR